MSAAIDDLTLAPLPRELLDAWAWTNRREPYALQQEGGTYRWVYAPCNTTALAAHLAGAATVALSCTDEAGHCRWLCLDADQADALPRLRTLADALTLRGLPALVEASRRGGHVWLLLDEPTPSAVVQRVVLHLLDELRVAGLELPSLEVYPDAAAIAAGALGHAVRLPLGTHRLIGRRYALFDELGYPCAFSSTEAALRFVQGWPRVASAEIVRRAHEIGPSESALVVRCAAAPAGGDALARHALGGRQRLPTRAVRRSRPRVRHAPGGQGSLGWCPFHDDEAPDSAGKPGTPSFYVVLDRVHGWSWRCFSSNCPQSWGSMRHSFELYQRLLGLTVRSAIVEACTRWPACDTATDPDKELSHAKAR